MPTRTLLIAAGLVLGCQLLYRSYASVPNVPVDRTIGVDADGSVPPPVMATLRHACFDCHSDETSRPWYSALPLASSLIERHVREGRGRINFSRWQEYHRFDRADMLDKVCERTTARDMPMWQYRMLHRDARLSDASIAALCAWTTREAARLLEPAP